MTKIGWQILCSSLVVGLSLFGSASSAVAERHALLIGVSEYTAPQVPSLEGPRNDIMLMHRVLRDAWGDDASITVLADGLEHSAYQWERPRADLPTRSNILDALAKLAATTVRGDEVLIYISGHGAQSPTSALSDATEPDGFDEIFFARDFRLQTDQAAKTVTIQNHLRDDEIGAAIDQFIKAGVFVWLVVDTCHAGTMERATVENFKPRFVSILRESTRKVVDAHTSTEPSSAPDTVAMLGGVSSNSEPPIEFQSVNASGFVGFYAAFPSEAAWELPMPQSATSDVQVQHGLLTFSLVQALKSGEAANYGDLARHVTASYWETVGAARPMFSGNLRHPPMIHTNGKQSFSLTMQNDKLQLIAGQIDGIAEGTIVAIRLGLQDSLSPVFFAQVEHSAMDVADLSVISTDVRYPNNLDRLLVRDGLRTSQSHRTLWMKDRLPALRAEIVETPIEFSLIVGRPYPQPNNPAARETLAHVNELLDHLDTVKVDQGVAVDVVDPDQTAELRLRVIDDRLWFLSNLGTIVLDGPQQPYSIPIKSLDGERLNTALRRIAKSRNLLRVARRFTETHTISALRLRLLVERSASQTVGACPAHPRAEPRNPPVSVVEVVSFGQRPIEPVRIMHCDRVWLELRNEGETPLDVSPFYFAPHGEVFYLRGYRDAIFDGLKIPPGETRIVSYTEDTAPREKLNPVGPMHLVLIAVQGIPGATNAIDFRHLEGTLPRENIRRPVHADLALFDKLLSDAASPYRGLRSTGVGEIEGAGTIIIPVETFAPDRM